MDILLLRPLRSGSAARTSVEWGHTSSSVTAICASWASFLTSGGGSLAGCVAEHRAAPPALLLLLLPLPPLSDSQWGRRGAHAGGHRVGGCRRPNMLRRQAPQLHEAMPASWRSIDCLCKGARSMAVVSRAARDANKLTRWISKLAQLLLRLRTAGEEVVE